MTNDTRFQAIEEEAPESSPWAHLHIAVIAPTGWTPHHVDAGIRSLDRLRAELDAATALLIATRPDDRDATAALSRLSNITNKEARKRRAVASVVTALPARSTSCERGRSPSTTSPRCGPSPTSQEPRTFSSRGWECRRKTSIVPCSSSASPSNTAKTRPHGNTRRGRCASRTAPTA